MSNSAEVEACSGTKGFSLVKLNHLEEYRCMVRVWGLCELIN